MAFSQAVPGQEIWDRFRYVPDTASAFKGEDLVVLKNDRIIRNGPLNSFPEHFEKDVISRYGMVPVSIEENFMQIYVRNERGARMTWQLQISVPRDRNLLTIKLRNRKPSGKIIELSEADTRYVMNQTSKTMDMDLDYSYLPVPGVDAGDVLEIYSSYFITGTLKSDEVYFHQFYPVCLSRFTYEHSRDYEISLMKYNFDRFDCRKTVPSDTSITYEFKNLPGLYSQQGILNHLELPFLVFRIDSILVRTPYSQDYMVFSSAGWDNAIRGYIDELLTNSPGLSEKSLSGPDNFFDRFNRRFPGASGPELALQWHRFLNDSISLRFISKEEAGLYMDHWLALRAADRSSLIAWYMHYFDYLDLDYTLYLSRELAYGYLDTTFVYTGTGMAIFLGVQDGQQEHFLFPKYETETYKADEFPSGLRGSLAVGLTIGQDEKETRIFQIPVQSRNDNWKNRILHSSITNPGSERILIDQRSYFSGEFAKSTRSWYDQFRRNTEPAEILENQMISEAGGTSLVTFDIDWNDSTIYHHSLAYECNNFISTHSDGSFSLRVKDISPLDVLHTLPFPRIFGYYNTVPYYNNTKFYLEFEKPVEMIGGDTIRDYFRNEFGSLRLLATVFNEKMILVETHYSADADYLPAGHYAAIEQLAGRTLQMQEKRIFFRFRR